MIEWLLVFVALFVTDFCWGLYIKKVQNDKPFQAGMWAVALFIPGAFVTLSYVQDHWLLLPASLGAFFGTYFSVKHSAL